MESSVKAKQWVLELLVGAFYYPDLCIDKL